jgi:Xaa-Pro aminopeptidase
MSRYLRAAAGLGLTVAIALTSAGVSQTAAFRASARAPLSTPAASPGAGPGSAQPGGGQPPTGYDYTREAARAAKLDLDNLEPAELQRTFSERRERVLKSIPSGAMLVFSVEQAQPRRLEFQVEHSENHDFIYLTGLEGLESLDSAILLLPTAEKNWAVLYTSGDVARIKETTGIDEVRPFAALEEDLSVALTDFRDWRITQIRRWPLPAALSKAWGRKDKAIYVNYPRFLRLRMQEPPRVEFFNRLREFSPELSLRDSADILDPIRMFQDAYSLASLRRAAQITVEGTVEGLRAVRPGMSEKQVMELIDFVYRYRGCYLGFPTAVNAMPMTGRPPGPSIPEGFIQFVPRSGAGLISAGEMVHVDTGAAFNHHSADVQRTVPVGGKFSGEQRRLYDVALNVQKTVISRIKPGVTWWELHNVAVQMLRDAGGYDQYYTYGIGHLLGMEVHDEGDYEQPLQPGMALTIEQGVAPPNGPRVALEDDVIVTETGCDWITRTLPIEVSDVEAMLAKPGSLDTFARKPALQIKEED